MSDRGPCEIVPTLGGVCRGVTGRRCGTCGRRACASHSRKPWDGPAWLCSDCEATHGAPPRPEALGDRQIRVDPHRGPRAPGPVQVFQSFKRRGS